MFYRYIAMEYTVELFIFVRQYFRTTFIFVRFIFVHLTCVRKLSSCENKAHMITLCNVHCEQVCNYRAAIHIFSPIHIFCLWDQKTITVCNTVPYNKKGDEILDEYIESLNTYQL